MIKNKKLLKKFERELIKKEGIDIEKIFAFLKNY